jgi:hypothetical protein
MFLGPLFIIGMPRTGSTLLRTLLNQHPRVGIALSEVQIIPYIIGKYGNPPRLEHDRLDEFCENFLGSGFFWKMREQGRELSRDKLLEITKTASWQSIFEAILRFYAPDGKEEGFIWGDKSVRTYMDQLPLLKSAFPQAKFLHIVRDPRDTCLSAKKTWGRSLYRAAEEWRVGVQQAHVDGESLGQDYKEMYYETLLAHPEQTLRDICQFLECEYVPAMAQLDNPVGGSGDAGHRQHIIANNKKKYQTQLSRAKIKRMEEIVYPIAKKMGYQIEYAVDFKPLSGLTLQIWRVYDGLASMRFHIREKGLYKGVQFFLVARHYKPKSTR